VYGFQHSGCRNEACFEVGGNILMQFCWVLIWRVDISTVACAGIVGLAVDSGLRFLEVLRGTSEI